MSREIKFRVHCAETGKVLAYESFNTRLNWGYYWVDATLPEDERTCKTLDYFKHPAPLGYVKRVQFTGLHDANGVEIWEGDVVKALYNSSTGTFMGSIHQVSYDPNLGFVPLHDDVDYDGARAEGTDWQVIGNIYEHPHLLDGSK